MDVVTQLEQACAHGCVLLSETFAVALRPSDPAFSGDGIALRQMPVAAAAPPPAAPIEDGIDDVGGSGFGVSAVGGSGYGISASSASSLRLSLSTAAVSLPHGANAPAVTVRRLGLHRSSPTSPPLAILPGTLLGAAGAASGSLMSASAEKKGDAFDLLPSSDMDLIGALIVHARPVFSSVKLFVGLVRLSSACRKGRALLRYPVLLGCDGT